MDNYFLEKDLTFISEGCECEEEHHYTYANQEAWKLYLGYYNPQKTPININTDKIVVKKIKYKIEYHHNINFKVIKNDHSMYFIPTLLTNHIIYEDKRYNLIQFHEHTSSENRIDDKIYPMEFHFVHEHIDTLGEKHHVVLALLVDITNEPKKSLKFTNGLFNYENDEEVILNLSHLNYLNEKQSYIFLGSLTTPPFTPGYYFIVHNNNLAIMDVDFLKFQSMYINNKANELSFYNKNRYVEDNYLNIFITK
jgi:carbonic anhydrase